MSGPKTKEDNDNTSRVKGDIPETLPIIPLKDTVIYPYTVMPIFVTEESSIKAVENAMSSQRIIGGVAVKNKESGDITTDDFYSIGTAAVIHKMLRMPEKGVALVVQGLVKISVKEYVSEDP